MQPTTFVQQMNTVSALTQGRVSSTSSPAVRVEEQRGYGDFLSHDERYARRKSFSPSAMRSGAETGDVDFAGKHYRVEQGKLATPFVSRIESRRRSMCRSLGTVGATRLLAGHVLAARRGRSGEAGADRCARTARGVGVCLRLCLVCRPTREEAIEVAQSLLPEDSNESTTTLKDDSQMYREGRRATVLTG
jgi:alkanesulfonate monooxygenase